MPSAAAGRGIVDPSPLAVALLRRAGLHARLRAAVVCWVPEGLRGPPEAVPEGITVPAPRSGVLRRQRAGPPPVPDLVTRSSRN